MKNDNFINQFADYLCDKGVPDNIAIIIAMVLYLVIIAGCIVLSIVITKAIVNSNMPTWLKFWLVSVK